MFHPSIALQLALDKIVAPSEGGDVLFFSNKNKTPKLPADSVPLGAGGRLCCVCLSFFSA